MTKRTILTVLMVYAGAATAAPLNYVQDSPKVGRADLNLTRPRAAALDRAWDATFMLLIHKPNGHVEYASAFVTFNANGPRGRRLQLVTSDHALGNFCDDRHCRGVEVYAEGRVRRDPRTNARALETAPLAIGEVRVLRRNAAADLALIQIVVNPSVNPAVVEFAQVEPVAGDDVYAVGFPNVFKGRADLNVEEPDVLARRWSQGRVVGRGAQNSAGDLELADDAELVTLSTPAKQGNSGGPVINADGYVVGVLAWAATTDAPAVASAAVNLRDLRGFMRLGDVASR